MATEVPLVTLEGARLMYRNFKGAENQFNREGDRNFAVVLDDRTAKDLLAQGWNVKETNPREDDDEAIPYLPVSVGYKGRPPRIVMMTSRARTSLGEHEVEVLDWADIENADLVVRAYDWDVNGKSGRKAYLKTLYVTIAEDAIEAKYAVDSGMGD